MINFCQIMWDPDTGEARELRFTYPELPHFRETILSIRLNRFHGITRSLPRSLSPPPPPPSEAWREAARKFWGKDP